MSVDWSRWRPAPHGAVGYQRVPPARCPRCGAGWTAAGAGRPRELSVACTCTIERRHTVWVCRCGVYAAEGCTDVGAWSASTVPVGQRVEDRAGL